MQSPLLGRLTTLLLPMPFGKIPPVMFPGFGPIGGLAMNIQGRAAGYIRRLTRPLREHDKRKFQLRQLADLELSRTFGFAFCTSASEISCYPLSVSAITFLTVVALAERFPELGNSLARDGTDALLDLFGAAAVSDGELSSFRDLLSRAGVKLIHPPAVTI